MEPMDSHPRVEKIPRDLKMAIESKVQGAKPSAVFVVNQDGTVIALTDGPPLSSNVPFPRPKDQIEWTNSITIFKYKNPAVCLMIGGTQVCF